MKEIQEIIRMISANKVKKIEIIGQSVSQTKLFKLYDLIANGEVTTDQEAIQILYPDVKNAFNPYFKLKYFLRRRLLNTIFFINTRGQQSTDYVKLLKMLVEIRILTSKSGGQIGVKMAKKLLKKAEQNEYWDLCVFASRFIRSHYVIREPNVRQFQKYDQKIGDFAQVDALGMEAEGLYYQLIGQMIGGKAANQQLLEKAKEFEGRLKDKKGVLPSIKLDFYKNAITAIKHMSAYDYDEAHKMLNFSLLALGDAKNVDNLRIVFLVNLVACSTYLKQYEAGRTYLEKALKYAPIGSFNWAQAKSTHVTLAFHSKKYADIPAIYLEVTKHSKFKKIPFIFREIWMLYYAWMYLLDKVGLVELPKGFISKKFNFDDWLGEIKDASKQKNGLSINIRIIKTIHWLLNEDYDALIDHDDSLKRYRYRYIKHSAHRRANLLLRYLINIQKREFIDYKCEYITQSAQKKLSEMPIVLRWENFEIEIVPFDDVIQIISDLMKKNARRIPKT